MNDKNFDINRLFNNEPDFTVDPQEYIDEYKKLLTEVDAYIKDLEEQIKDAEDFTQFLLRSQLIFIKYQRTLIAQMMNAIRFENN